jgi:hypothetical protein
MSNALRSAGLIFLGIAITMHAAAIVRPAAAQDLPGPVVAWFDALRAADAEAFDALLAEGAEIDLRYLGVVQTRAEFIESLDAWGDAIKGGEVLTKAVSAGPERVVVDVCYRFPSNQKVNRETFSIASEKVTRLVQEETAQNCDAFGD